MAPVVTATLILFAGVVDDLRSRKVHNWLFLTCTAVAIIFEFSQSGLAGLNHAFLGFIAGLLALLPLVLAKVIGAGDMKLFAAFGAVVGWSIIIDVAILSLVWGAVFGLIQVAVKGQLVATFKNMFALISMKDRKSIQLHKMPFTIAIFFAWLSHLVLHKGTI